MRMAAASMAAGAGPQFACTAISSMRNRHQTFSENPIMKRVHGKLKRMAGKAPAVAILLVVGLSACGRPSEPKVSPQRPVSFSEGEVGKTVITPMEIGARPSLPQRGWM